MFPVQGVRPVFSSVADILESNLSKLLFEALMDDADDHRRSATTSQRDVGRRGGRTRLASPYSRSARPGARDAVADMVASVSVHEAGHAVAYGVLFGLAPLQLTARWRSQLCGGFTFPHEIVETATPCCDKGKVLLAGGLAEESSSARDATVGRANATASGPPS